MLACAEPGGVWKRKEGTSVSAENVPRDAELHGPHKGPPVLNASSMAAICPAHLKSPRSQGQAVSATC